MSLAGYAVLVTVIFADCATVPIAILNTPRNLAGCTRLEFHMPGDRSMTDLLTVLGLSGQNIDFADQGKKR